MEHILILGLLVATLLMFAFEVVRADLVAMIVALILMLTGTITVEEGFSGFSNPAVITVIAMFILSSGLIRTGVADQLAVLLLKIAGNNPALLTLAIMLTVGVMSAFMNNIAATAILIPTVFAMSEKTRYPASKLLIPLSFGSLLGGITTLVGTPPNLLVSGVLEQNGFSGFKMFDFTPLGAIVFLLSLVYMVFIGRHLLPARRRSKKNLASQYELDDYITELVVKENSNLVGKTLEASKIRETLGLSVIQIQRMTPIDKITIAPYPETILQANDILVVEGNLKQLVDLGQSAPLAIQAKAKFEADNSNNDNLEMAEVAIAPNAPILGRSIQFSDIRRRFGVLVIAMRRREKALQDNYTSVPLEVGDVMLVQGRASAITRLAGIRDFLVVNRLEHAPRRNSKAPIAVGIMSFSILLAGFDILHISIAAFIGVLLMTLSGCIKADEMYRDVEWRVIFLIAFLMPLGIAMDSQHVGTADWLASHILNITTNNNPMLALACLVLITTMLTEIMSNAATAVLMAPIGISVAAGLGLEPYPFMIAIALAASTTFLTPIGHQANVLVYGVGGYRFTDFSKVGALLNLIIIFTLIVGVSIFWPFQPLAK